MYHCIQNMFWQTINEIKENWNDQQQDEYELG